MAALLPRAARSPIAVGAVVATGLAGAVALHLGTTAGDCAGMLLLSAAVVAACVLLAARELRA
jgi:hypothetical protein